MTTSLPAERKYDLYSQALKDNPYPVFERMRQDDPVFSQPGIDGKTMIWFVSRYDDVQAMLHDEQRFVRDPGSLLPSSMTGLPTDLENLLNAHSQK